MNYHIQAVTIFDKNSPYHGCCVHLTIQDGQIAEIVKATPAPKTSIVTTEGDVLVHLPACYVSPGFVDMRTNICDPGYEFKETLDQTLEAASAGGFAYVATLPKTNPIVQHKDALQHLLYRSHRHSVQVLPLAALSKDLKGEELTEFLDLHAHGACAFTDGDVPISHAGLLVRALQYAKHCDALIIQHPEETQLTLHGQMHEGTVSTYLGMRGIPELAESICIQRDIELLRYTGGRLHFSRISSEKAVALIQQAKDENLNVSCDVSVAHLCFTHEKLLDWDTNFKLNPPLRTEADRMALWKGIEEGVIDAIVTDHTPQDIESKALEFNFAAPGMLMLQTALPALLMYKPDFVQTENIIRALTAGPARLLLRSDAYFIDVGKNTPLTLWSPEATWQLQEENVLSASRNTPFLGQPLKGNVLATLHKAMLQSKPYAVVNS